MRVLKHNRGACGVAWGSGGEWRARSRDITRVDLFIVYTRPGWVLNNEEENKNYDEFYDISPPLFNSYDIFKISLM